RSVAMPLAAFQIPCRLGLPSAVRGIAPGRVWASSTGPADRPATRRAQRTNDRVARVRKRKMHKYTCRPEGVMKRLIFSLCAAVAPVLVLVLGAVPVGAQG